MIPFNEFEYGFPSEKTQGFTKTRQPPTYMTSGQME